MKAVQYRTLMAEKSDKAMMLAVKACCPQHLVPPR
jgi:hypothetical protein